MICGNVDHLGDVSNFPYRSSSYLTEFFEDCNLEQFVHDGSTRKWWVAGVLDQIVQQPTDEPALPSPEFQTVIKVLMDKADVMEHDPERAAALSELNASLAREGLEAFYADDNCCYVRNTRTGVEGMPGPVLNRGLSTEEKRRQERLEDYLDQASEDDIIANVLLPLFQTLRFYRVSVAGHTDKALEYGKDVWMKHLRRECAHSTGRGWSAHRARRSRAGAVRQTRADLQLAGPPVPKSAAGEGGDRRRERRAWARWADPAHRKPPVQLRPDGNSPDNVNGDTMYNFARRSTNRCSLD